MLILTQPRYILRSLTLKFQLEPRLVRVLSVVRLSLLLSMGRSQPAITLTRVNKPEEDVDRPPVDLQMVCLF